ncbi:MAG: formate dehydrogenase accessory sulfurtransferase FdhD [Anaerovoracaceae bacterium]
MEETKEIKILRVEEGKTTEAVDVIVVEKAVEFYLDGVFLSSTVCLDRELEALALGQLISQGRLRGSMETPEISIKGGRIDLCSKGIGREGENQPPSKGTITLTPKQISLWGEVVYQGSPLFQQTGMIHSCGLFSSTELLEFSEDLGRHNAVDKVLGKAWMKGRALSACALFTSGRMPLDMVNKAICAGIPIMISRSAPTAEAVEAAQAAGVTLVGFVRKGRMNLYTHAHRITGR